MMWIETAVTCVVGAVAFTVVAFRKRPADVSKLGALSDRWITQHRGGS